MLFVASGDPGLRVRCFVMVPGAGAGSIDGGHVERLATGCAYGTSAHDLATPVGPLSPFRIRTPQPSITPL